jgi:hypothetical protein
VTTAMLAMNSMSMAPPIQLEGVAVHNRQHDHQHLTPARVFVLGGRPRRERAG